MLARSLPAQRAAAREVLVRLVTMAGRGRGGQPAQAIGAAADQIG